MQQLDAPTIIRLRGPLENILTKFAGHPVLPVAFSLMFYNTHVLFLVPTKPEPSGKPKVLHTKQFCHAGPLSLFERPACKTFELPS
jgi:hypothetical protein